MATRSTKAATAVALSAVSTNVAPSPNWSRASLNGANRYTVTFAKDQTPPAYGFWSLTLYDAAHFFVPNELNRFSLGTKNKDLVFAKDGSLTIYVQADPPPEAQRANWLPAPKADLTLFLRAYWPKTPVIDGSWTPPPVEKQK